MFAVFGITGQVGSAVADSLLHKGLGVRALVRSLEKGEAWARKGCEIAITDLNDTMSLQDALRDTDGVFVMLPPNFDPSPGFPEARSTIASIRTALALTRPAKVVCLSTIGAQSPKRSLLTQLQILEDEVGSVSLPITFLRPAWFMENFIWDVDTARTSGILYSFFQPDATRIPMVAAADVGKVAADILLETWQGTRIVEVEGPKLIAPEDVASHFAHLLNRDVRLEEVPRESWDALFRSHGMKNPEPRIQMLEGFNEGWIAFEATAVDHRKESTTLETVLRTLVECKLKS